MERELGTVRLSVLRPTAPRTPSYTGTSGSWQVVVAADGPLALGPGSHAARLEPGDLMLWGPAEPFEAAADDGATGTARAVVLQVPESVLPVPAQALRDLVARPLSARTGPAALLARFVEELAGAEAPIEPSQAVWLGRAAVNLTVAALTGAGAICPLTPAQQRQETLLREVKSYVEARLGEPDLAPPSIASAHHMSVRHLHYLFQQDELTVAGYVRTRRLERCRADLNDPALAELSVGLIRARWGFQDAAVFSRAFKREYGISPGAYRRRRPPR